MKREYFPINDIKKILKKYNNNSISISPHYIKYISNGKRDINEGEIINFLLNKVPYIVEKQINHWIRYKVVYEISNKYDLIIIIKEELEQKSLKVASAYKTNRKLKEKWTKNLKYLMKK